MSDAYYSLSVLAWRSLWRNRRRTLITLSSIILGLTLVMILVCIGEGVYARLVDDAVRLQGGHVTLMHRGYMDAPSADLYIGRTNVLRNRIEKLSGVERTKGLVLGQALVKTATGAVGAMVMGVEPLVETGTSPLPGRIKEGRYLSGDGGAQAVIGAAMAERLNLRVGSKFVLAANDTRGGMVEELCRVRGIFRMGSDEMDGYLIQVPVGFARRLYGLPKDALTYLGVVLDDSDTRHAVAKLISNMPESSGYSALPWEKVLPEVASYIRLDRTQNYIFQAILMFLVLFTIFNTILMSVLEREREFGVLLALGTAPMRLRVQVFLESVYLNLAGVGGGLLLGGLLVWYYQVHGIDFSRFTRAEMSISGFSMQMMLHPRLTAGILGWIGGLVYAATLLLSLYPVWRSTRMDLAGVLR